MKIALIEACDPDWQFKRFSYPLQLGYLSSYTAKYHEEHEVVVLDTVEEILKVEPEIVGISSYSMNYGIAKDMAKQIKDNLGIPIILGGCHISALPETFDNAFNAAVLGEGEQTFLEVLELFQNKRRLVCEDLHQIEGLLFLEEGKPVFTKPRNSIRRIDTIPPPNRSLYKVRSGLHYISTSRGCPFKCLFCAPRLMWRDTRYFSASYVIKEIMGIIGQFADSFTHLSIVDDLFISNKKRMIQLSDWFVQTGLNKIVISQANVRADLIDDHMAEILAKMNFQTVNFGAESGSEKILKYYNKKASVEDNQRAVDILHKHGIKAIPSFIVGAPVETKEDFDATLEFIEKNHGKLAGFEIFPLIPMPGSLMWNYAAEKGLVDHHIDWTRLEPLLLDFDPERYIYLIENVSKDVFLDYIKKFQEIYKQYNPSAMKFREMLQKDKV